jgi:hypothetical protein
VENALSSSEINNMKSVFRLHILDYRREGSGAMFGRMCSARRIPAIDNRNEYHSHAVDRSIASFYSTMGAVEVS